jgi:hypothetical protein
MIAQQVAARGDFSDQVRALPNKSSDQKKCRAHGVAIEQFEKLRGDGWIWAIVKGESDLRGGIRVPHGTSEQFRRWGNRAPGSDPRRCYGRYNDGQRIQIISGADFRTAWLAVPAAESDRMAGVLNN